MKGSFHFKFSIQDPHWVKLNTLDDNLRGEIQIQFGRAALPATIKPVTRSCCIIELDQPHRPIVAGQMVVMYREGTLLGSGMVEYVY